MSVPNAYQRDLRELLPPEKSTRHRVLGSQLEVRSFRPTRHGSRHDQDQSLKPIDLRRSKMGALPFDAVRSRRS